MNKGIFCVDKVKVISPKTIKHEITMDYFETT